MALSFSAADLKNTHLAEEAGSPFGADKRRWQIEGDGMEPHKCILCFTSFCEAKVWSESEFLYSHYFGS